MGDLHRINIVDIDLSRPIAHTRGLMLAEGDQYANRIGARIFRDGEPVDVQACGVTGNFIRTSKGDMVYTKGKAEGNVVFVDLDPNCYAYDGTYVFSLNVKIDNVNTTVRIVEGFVKRLQSDTVVDPGNVLPNITDIQELMAKVAGVIPEDSSAHMQLVTDEEGTPVWLPALAYRHTDREYLLRDTALTTALISGTIGEYDLSVALAGDIDESKTYILTVDGTEYTSKAVSVESAVGETAYIMGNKAYTECADYDVENPDATAPYGLLYVPGGMGGAYGMVKTVGITPDPLVLSIRTEAYSIKKIDPEYLPDIGSPVPETTEPNMHLVTDADGKMAWEAKGGGDVVVLEETTFALNEGQANITTPPAVEVKAGKTYNVYYNGTLYECEGVGALNQGMIMVLLGATSNAGISGGNEDAPFVVVYIPSDVGAEAGYYAMVMDLTGADSVTMSITISKEQAEGTAAPLYIEADILYQDGAYVVNSISASFIEVQTAILDNRDVICITSHPKSESTYYSGKSVLRLVSYRGMSEIILGCRSPMLSCEVAIKMESSGTNTANVWSI